MSLGAGQALGFRIWTGSEEPGLALEAAIAGARALCPPDAGLHLVLPSSAPHDPVAAG